MAKHAALIRPEQIERSIQLIRGQRVILDMDLAILYDVATKNLNRAVNRNRERFPDDFMFQLSDDEFTALRFHFGTSKGRGGRRYAPYAFTEHGAIMAASVLNTPRAIEVSVFVVRAFVKVREFIATHKELVHKLAELERKVGGHDEAIRSLVATIRQLMSSATDPKKGKIGFARENQN
jgi:ORF6N domain